ncbi:MAG TPA: hypothetical protein VGX68_14330 [Thermoanaerobaculia bacterium]|jgi:hypothetical protein|nr:hypothetical protein [Thermoanaerobaculia bacterium]
MRFAERNLPPYAEPVSSSDLKEGSVYFAVNYADDRLLIPIMETVVFVGRDLEPSDSGQVYFQDINSYRRGVRFGAHTEGDYAQFSAGSEKEVNHIFRFQQALEELMRCSLRRQENGEAETIMEPSGST